MNKLGMSIPHRKRRGEWAELRFMTSAAEHGLCVSRPWGDSAHYDFIVDSQTAHLLRIQVKSTRNRQQGGYRIKNAGSAAAYPPGAYDFLAVYIVPRNLWYIVPESVVAGRLSVVFYPKKDDHKFSRYREAWDLLGCEKK